MKPFFSIGVTSYKRYDLLRECLESILLQTFTDFEIIVGNDYPEQEISADFLGIDDPRIRYVNHAKNVGPIHNANALLALSKGRYFTWLADDDMHLPNFLEVVHPSLASGPPPPCLFTSYLCGETYPGAQAAASGFRESYRGGEFLDRYLSRTLRTIGCYGLFDSDYLRGIGGMEHLGRGYFSPYSDNLLVVRAGLLDSVIYHSAELVFFRTHATSVSYTSPNIDVYAGAQADFLAKSLAILGTGSLKEHCHAYLFMLLDWCVKDFDSVVRRSGSISTRQIRTYLQMLRRYLGYLSGTSFSRQAWTSFAKIALLMTRDLGLRRIRLHA